LTWPMFSRRDFLKLVATVATLLGVNAERAVKALSETTLPIVWFLGQGCVGCSTSLLEATSINVESFLADGLGFAGSRVKIFLNPLFTVLNAENYLEALKAAWKGERYTFDDGNVIDFSQGYILVLEGSFNVCGLDSNTVACVGMPGALYCYLGFENSSPVPCTEWVRRLLTNARAVVAVGSCAAYGGVRATRTEDIYNSAGIPNAIGTLGFFPDPVRGLPGLVELLDTAKPFKTYMETKGACDRRECKPVVAVPGCPANGEATLRTLIAVALQVLGLIDAIKLDEYWRPTIIYGETTHKQCPRLRAYRAKRFREEPGEPTDECLFKVGCRGKWSYCPWNMVGWVNGAGGPTRVGGICIGCTMPGFPDSYEPFYKEQYVGGRRERKRGRRRTLPCLQ